MAFFKIPYYIALCIVQVWPQLLKYDRSKCLTILNEFKAFKHPISLETFDSTRTLKTTRAEGTISQSGVAFISHHCVAWTS